MWAAHCLYSHTGGYNVFTPWSLYSLWFNDTVEFLFEDLGQRVGF